MEKLDPTRAIFVDNRELKEDRTVCDRLKTLRTDYINGMCNAVRLAKNPLIFALLSPLYLN